MDDDGPRSEIRGPERGIRPAVAGCPLNMSQIIYRVNTEMCVIRSLAIQAS